MSDHEDAMSEVAPEGWSVMFNQMKLGSPVMTNSTKDIDAKASKSEVSEGNSWFSGWFGSPTSVKKSAASSISSDTPPIVESDGRSDEDEPSPKGLNEDEFSEGSRADSDLDSDGFVKSGNEEEGAEHLREEESSPAASEPSSPSSRGSVVLAEEPVSDLVLPKSASRKLRVMKRQQFEVPLLASELVESEDPPPAEESWWGKMFGSQPVVEATPEENEKQVPTTEPIVATDVPPEDKPAGKGLWDRMFGSSEDPKTTTRALLPEIALPPAVMQDVNSFFPDHRNGLSPSGISILGPGRVFGRFEGKVRGWPRRFAPHFSSENVPLSPTRFSKPPSGPSALAMFRVT